MSDTVRTELEQASDWLVLLREAPGDASMQARFEDWLDARPEHAVAWVVTTETFDTIGAIGPEMEEAWRGAASPRRGLLPWRGAIGRTALAWGAIAASLALWLAPAAMLHLQSDSETQAGEMRQLRLADGSMVQMGPASAIAVDYGKGQRTVRLLKGEAWFDVRHNPSAPFHVIAGDVRTTVLGTSFDVRRVGGATIVSLKRGRVHVEDRGAGPVAGRDLVPGQWVRVDADHRIESGTDNPDLFGAWQTGTLVAHDRPVGDVIEALRPWYRGRILVMGGEMERRRVDGVYNARDTQSALTALVSGAGGHVRQVSSWLILVY